MNDYDIGSAKNVQVELNLSAQFQPNIQQNQIEPISYSGISNNQTVKCIICPSCQTTFQIPKENMQTNQNLNQQLLQNNITIDYNFEVSLNRRMLIQKINLLNIYQQLFQVLLMLLCNLFFPIYWFDHIRVIFFLTIPITIAFLLIVRFNKSLRKSRKSQCIYLVYFLLYSLFANSIAFGEEYFWWQANSNYLFVIFYYFSTFNFWISFAILVQLILIHVQIKKLKGSNLNFITFLVHAFYSVFFLFFIVFCLLEPSNLYTFFVQVTSIVWPFIFTSFYIPSLLQIYKGKFQLGVSQHHIGIVLAQVNMFLLCVGQ